MAKVLRRRTLVNAARRRARQKPRKRRRNVRRRLTDKQVRYFGTPAQKAALRRRRKRKRTPAKRRVKRRVSKRRNAVRSRRTARRRKRNVSTIYSLGLAAAPANPRRKRRKKTMARRKKTRRRRRSTNRRRRANVAASSNPRRRRRYNRRRRRRSRRNPAALGRVGGLFTAAAYTIFGAVGTRAVTQLALGATNRGVIGYGSNALAALILGWGVGKFMKNRAAGTAVTIGGFVGLTLRLIQDLTPLGRFVNLQLAGMGRHGDAGVGMLLPSSYLDPALFTGSGAERYVPAGIRPAAVAGTLSGLGRHSTYATSSYRT